MATIKLVNGSTTETYYSSTSKITTPSIVIEGASKYYIPLFIGSAGATVTYNNYNYTLGHLKVGNYNGALTRTAAYVISVSILHRPYHIRNGKIFSINPLVFSVSDSGNSLLTVAVKSLGPSGSPSWSNNRTWNNILGRTLTFSGTVKTLYKYMSNYNIYIQISASNGNSTKTVDVTDINSDSVANNQFENKLYWIDGDNTWYAGNRVDDVINITSHNGTGTPYQYFSGFSSSDVGKTVKWDVYDSTGASVKSQWLENCSKVYETPTIEYFNNNSSRGWHLVTQNSSVSLLESQQYGVKICEGSVPNGEFDIVMVVDDTTVRVHDYGVHINMNDASNGAVLGSDASTVFNVKLTYYYGKVGTRYTLYIKAELVSGSDCVKIYSLTTDWDSASITSGFSSYKALSSYNNARQCTIYVTLQSIDNRRFRYKGGATGNVDVVSAVYQISHVDTNINDNTGGTTKAETKYVSVVVNGNESIKFS